MPSIPRVARQLRSLMFWKPSVDEEVDEELAFHVEMRAREYVERGMDPAEAHAAAIRKFGDIDGVHTTCRHIGERRDREMRNAEWIDELRNDVVFAVRQLRRNPGFATVAIVALALGIGATTTIFSVVNGVLLRPLPFDHPDRVVRIYENEQKEPVSWLDYRDWRDQAKSFEDVALLANITANLTGEQPERLRGNAVTANFFHLFHIPTSLGRGFAPGDDAAGAPRIVVLSYELWQRRFGGNRAIIGTTIPINGEPATVVGVADRDQRYPLTTEVWLPFNPKPIDHVPSERGGHAYTVFARMTSGVSFDAANAEMHAIQKRLNEQYPTATGGFVGFLTLQDDIVGDVRRPLFVLLGAVGLVLLIACANVANLLLVRSSAREAEIAVRTALGAGRGRLSRQLITESVLLSLIGGVTGVLGATWAIRFLKTAKPGDLPRIDSIALDGRVLGVSLLIAVVTGMVFGLVPALHATSPDLARSLRGGTRGALSGSGSTRVRGALVVAEFALSLMLLAGAGLLIKSFYKLQLVNPGFSTDSVMTFNVALPPAKYRGPAAMHPFASALEERLQRIPGVASAAVVYMLPMGEVSRGFSFSIVGQVRDPKAIPDAAVPAVTKDFFSTLKIPLVSGRVFDSRDREDAPLVAIVDRATAKRYFKGVNPVGQRIVLDDPAYPDKPREIIGLVGDVHGESLAQEPVPQIYTPLAQSSGNYLTAIIRTKGSPRGVIGAARAQVAAIDPTLPTFGEKTMSERVENTVAGPRFYMMLLASFAAVALVLASVGIYGVMSYAVSQLTRDIGIRVALGASQGEILRLIVKQGMVLTGLGIVIGLAGAAAMGRVIGGLLFGTEGTDLLTFAAVTVVLSLVSLAACLIPARRAAGVDPLVAFRG